MEVYSWLYLSLSRMGTTLRPSFLAISSINRYHPTTITHQILGVVDCTRSAGLLFTIVLTSRLPILSTVIPFIPTIVALLIVLTHPHDIQDTVKLHRFNVLLCGQYENTTLYCPYINLSANSA